MNLGQRRRPIARPVHAFVVLSIMSLLVASCASESAAGSSRRKHVEHTMMKC
jgi:hypothetical protein